MLFKTTISLLICVSLAMAVAPFGDPQPHNPYGNPPSPPVLPVPDWTQTRFFDAFRFPTDDIANGGCTADQKRKLQDAFNEVIHLARLVYDYVSEEIRGVTPNTDVGDLMYYVFGVHPSYYISNPDGGGSYDGGVMVLIAKHAMGGLSWHGLQTIRITRLYCNSNWLVPEEYERDDNGLQTAIKFPEGERFYDKESNYFSPIPWGGRFVLQLGMCGPVGSDPEHTDAITDLSRNTITFCPEVWKPAHPVQMPIAIANPVANPPQSIDTFDSISWSFMHEYTHLIGQSVFGGEGVVDHVNAAGKIAYGYADASQLSSSDRAVTNADSYVLLAVGCLLNQYDWSDGCCRYGSLQS
ncbi:hypothetical protein DL98DRAFT_590613 [Cadophora sp. DSE1049]|nr:hypothetical protein DL98DRAFT_590613 [Cadophora sp. DSE1049]